MVNRKLSNGVRLDATIERKAKQKLKDMAREAGPTVTMSDLVREAIEQYIGELEAEGIKKELPRDVALAFKVLEYLRVPVMERTRVQSVALSNSSAGLIVGDTSRSRVKAVLDLAKEILCRAGAKCDLIDDQREYVRQDKRVVVEKIGFVFDFHKPLNSRKYEDLVNRAREDYEVHGQIVRETSACFTRDEEDVGDEATNPGD